MDQFNLLDLNNDVLNIIGDYVKADNDGKKFQKYLRGEVINNSIKLLKIIKNASFTKKDMRDLIINYFYVNNIRDIVTIDLCLTLMKLNLKQKKIYFFYILY